MVNELSEFDEITRERPGFLKTLCILTFIFSSFSIITNFVSVINPEKASKMITTSQRKVNDSLKSDKSISQKPRSNIARKMMVTLSGFSAERIRKNALGVIVSSILCIVGAFLMWKLKKIGYAIYILGVIVSIIVPYLLFGNNAIAIFMVAFAAFFGALFIIFYGMNLKSMN